MRSPSNINVGSGELPAAGAVSHIHPVAGMPLWSHTHWSQALRALTSIDSMLDQCMVLASSDAVCFAGQLLRMMHQATTEYECTREQTGQLVTS